MSADLYFTKDSSFFLLFLISYTLSSLNGTKAYSATWAEESVILKCMSEIWGIPSPTNRGPKTHKSSHLKANFNGLYLRNET